MTSYSIIIPTLGDRGGALKRAIYSAIHHISDDIEVIVVDDCTPDDSVRAATAGLPVRYIRRHRNGGVAAAQNSGIDESEGQFITFLHSDDAIPSDRLWRSVPKGIAVGRLKIGQEMISSSLANATVEDLLWHRFGVHIASCVFDRELLEKVRFDEALRSWEDWDLLLRIWMLQAPVEQYDECFARLYIDGDDRLSFSPAMSIALPTLYHKHRGLIWGDRRLRALWEFKIARLQLRSGNTTEGRRWLRKSLARDPLHPRRWVYAASREARPRAPVTSTAP